MGLRSFSQQNIEGLYILRKNPNPNLASDRKTLPPFHCCEYCTCPPALDLVVPCILSLLFFSSSCFILLFHFFQLFVPFFVVRESMVLFYFYIILIFFFILLSPSMCQLILCTTKGPLLIKVNTHRLGVKIGIKRCIHTICLCVMFMTPTGLRHLFKLFERCA